MKNLLALIVIVLTVSACGSSKHAKGKKGKGELSFTEQTKFDNIYFEAIKQKALGNFSEASKLFAQSLEVNPNAHAAMHQLADIFLANRNTAYSVFWAEKAVETNSEYNYWYLDVLGKSYSRAGDFQKASDIYQIIVDFEPERRMPYLQLTDQLVNVGKFKEAIDALSSYEERFGIDEESARKKELLYFELKKPEEGIKSIEALIKTYPNTIEFRALLAESYLKNEQKEKAKETYNEMLEIDSLNGIVYIGLANIAKDDGNEEETFMHLSKAFNDPFLPIRQKIKVLATYFDKMDGDSIATSRALLLSEQITEVHPKEAEGFLVRSDVLSRNGNLEEARTSVAEAVEIDPSQIQNWQKLLELDEKLQKPEWLAEDSKKAIEYFPNQPFLFIVNAYTNYQLNNYAEVISIAEEGLEVSLKPNDKIDLLLILGDTYNETGDFDKSDATFEELLEMNPRNDGALNNYAYYLSLRNVKLDKALEMAQKAMSINPNRLTYQDTYGWVLYKLGRYEEAVTILEKVYKASPDDVEVATHFAESLIKTDRAEEGKAILKLIENR